MRKMAYVTNKMFRNMVSANTYTIIKDTMLKYITAIIKKAGFTRFLNISYNRLNGKSCN